jgi:hypothetical protein
MKTRDYCCCAIPTVNAGIYAVLIEQLVLGIVLGTLAVAAPASEHPFCFFIHPLLNLSASRRQ